MPDDTNTSYINTTDYEELETKLKEIDSTLDELQGQAAASRKMRYAEVQVESEKSSGKLAPDELYIPQHIIDSNIRREQSSYVQYVVQSPRAVILENVDTPTAETSLLEKDVTSKIRFDGWQMSMFACIDGFQQDGYGVMEIVLDQSMPGELAHEFVQKQDFGLVLDTKDIQDAELLVRNYYFSKTKLLQMAMPEEQGGRGFNPEQVNQVVSKEPSPNSNATSSTDSKDKSLFKIQKCMFRVGGVVQVAWSCSSTCDGWLRDPRPLFIGRKKAVLDPMTQQPAVNPMTGVPQSQDVPETDYPYYLYPYLISENNTIAQLKGRVFLDQDTQEAASSLLSSFCTAHRRAAGLYFSKDTSDPNDDVMMQKNVYFQTGCLINAKVTQFQLTAPSTDLLAGVQSLVTSNQQQTSQVNFAAQNRKDSRKTAAEINAATQEQQQLSTVQVVLFSNALRNMYQCMFNIMKSRVLAGLIKVQPPLQQMYGRRYTVKPSGDVDVIERQKMIAMMQQSWPVMQNTPAAQAFLSDMLVKMFPDNAPKYLQIFQQAQQQAASQQAQQQQMAMQAMGQMAEGIVKLSQQPEMFSDTGKVHALPALKGAADKIEQMKEMQKQQQQPKQS